MKPLEVLIDKFYFCEKPMRTAEDICLLCKINKSTKTNSHILPRFISTDFLGPKGGPRRGYELSSDQSNLNKKRVIQDSPKESYILCDDCEAYFSILESMAAPTFKLWREKVQDGEFSKRIINEHLSIVNCDSADPKVMRLLVYSMFWRASISSHGLFDNYRLAPATEEFLRLALMSVRSLTQAELKQKLKTLNLVIHPYAAVTSDSFKDETANVVAAINPGNPASLHVDRFGFLLFNSREDIRDAVFSHFSNATPEQRMLMVLAQPLWQELMVEKTASVYAESVKTRQNK